MRPHVGLVLADFDPATLPDFDIPANTLQGVDRRDCGPALAWILGLA